MKSGLKQSLSSARVFLTKASAWLRRKSAESVQKPKAALDRWDQDVEDNIGVQPSQSLAKIMLTSLVAMSAAAFAWLALATTDEVVKAQGKLQPIDDVKVVQMPLGGVLKEMLVKDGERVRKDQILLRLDNEATLERAKSTSEEIRAKEAQLKLKQIELERYLSLNDARMRVLKRKLDLYKTILARLERLSKLGASPELQYLQQVNEVAEVEGELETTVIVRERQLAILNQSVEKLKGELADLKGKLTEITVYIRYKDIRSPVDGVVFDLKPTGLGYVAQSSEPVMKIVPYNALLAKINIDSADIGFVRAGKQVDISIDSFPANDFGVIEGTIDRIGSDALPPNQRENFYRYPAMIKLNTQQLKLRSGKQLPLQAGMSLTANIKLRKVTWLQLLLGGFRDKTDSLKQL